MQSGNMASKRHMCTAERAHTGDSATAEGCQEGGAPDRNPRPVTPQGALLPAHCPGTFCQTQDERLWGALLPM